LTPYLSAKFNKGNYDYEKNYICFVNYSMFKRNFLEILRWGLRLHGIGHLVEVVSAVSEGAYITASLALIFISIELLASFYLPKEHIHFKPIKSDVHEDCKD